jgi:[acyl-carrier-protein] S-malonyltransferase
VRWDLCLASLRTLGVTAAIELAPAGTLTGINKRELTGVRLLALKTPADLETARELLATAASRQTGEAVRVVKAPDQGIFTRAQGLDAGEAISSGARIGTIRTDRDEFAIVAPTTGVLEEWLKWDGDVVSAGLPVARLSTGSLR